MPSLMRRAVSEAHVNNNFAVESEMIQLLSAQVARLENFQERVGSGKLTREMALEAETLTGEVGFVQAFDKVGNSRRIRSVAMEGIIGSIFSAIGAMISALVGMIGKFLSWMFGGGSKSAGGGGGKALSDPATVKETQKATKDTVEAAQGVAKLKSVQEAQALVAKTPENVTAAPASTKKPGEMTDAEKQARAAAMADENRRKVRGILNRRVYMDIIMQGNYTQAFQKFIHVIDFRLTIKKVVDVHELCHKQMESFITEAQELDDKAADLATDPRLQKPFVDQTVNSRLEEFSARVDKALEEARHTQEREKENNKLLAAVKEVQTIRKQEDTHGVFTEADHKALHAKNFQPDLPKIFKMMEEMRFEELSKDIANTKHSIGNVQRELAEDQDQFTQLAIKAGDESGLKLQSAMRKVYSVYAAMLGTLHDQMTAFATACSELEMFYKDLITTMSRVFDIFASWGELAEEVAKAIGEKIASEDAVEIKAFKSMRTEFKHYIPA